MSEQRKSLPSKGRKAGRPAPGAGRRSEVIGVRLDPKLKYLAEIAARKQRRSLSSYIEWVISQSLDAVVLREASQRLGPATVASESERLWDVDESDRFVRLVYRYPDLLTHHEQMLWKLARECGFLWKIRSGPNSTDFSEDVLDRPTFRAWWEKLNAVVNNEIPRSELPQWNEQAGRWETGKGAS